MAKWIRFNLNGGEDLSGKSLVNIKQTFQPEMTAPDISIDILVSRPEFPVSDVTSSYNRGWMTNTYRGNVYSDILIRKIS